MSDIHDVLYDRAQGLDPLQFRELRDVNVRRCGEAFHPIESWNPAEWSNAMAGECGEACNITKKIIRGDYDGDRAKYTTALMELGKELADVLIYADLLAARLGIDLGLYVRLKFNEVSRRRNATIFLPPRPDSR